MNTNRVKCSLCGSWVPTSRISSAMSEKAIQPRPNALAFSELKQTAARTIPAPKDLQQIGLTVREGEVLHWVIQGKRDREIAAILSTSPRTIHNHLRSILRKLNTETRTRAALEALERLNGSSASRGL